LSLTYLPSPSEYRTKFLRELGQVLKVVARAFASPASGMDAAKAIHQAFDGLRSSSIDQHAGWSGRIAELLRLPEDDPDGWEAWAEVTKLEWRRLADRVTRSTQVVEVGDGRSLGQIVDEITHDFLGEVASLWDLGPLAEVAMRGDHLVLQVEDALQAVPLAHYPLPDGSALYTHVRSVRASLSVLVSLLQRQLERDLRPRPGRVLTVPSFLRRDDAARPSTRWLHHGQRWLAEHYRLTSLHAADRPAGVPGTVRTALDPHRDPPDNVAKPAFRVATLCGHGSTREAGLVLADGPWRGDGCDCTRVDLLILLSCSVGRLNQVGDLDAEGLCVELALCRARSVLACRWPVLSLPAVAFVNEVAHHYLESTHPDAPLVGTDCARAEAVQRARLRFLGPDGRPGGKHPIGLNTVAAFELYGLA
jgi:hypothetical protein